MADIGKVSIKVSITILDARAWSRWIRMFLSITSVVVLPILLGIWMQSTAMQWVGFFMCIVLMFNIAGANVKRFTSIEEAKAYLNSLKEE